MGKIIEEMCDCKVGIPDWQGLCLHFPERYSFAGRNAEVELYRRFLDISGEGVYGIGGYSSFRIPLSSILFVKWKYTTNFPFIKKAVIDITYADTLCRGPLRLIDLRLVQTGLFSDKLRKIYDSLNEHKPPEGSKKFKGLLWQVDNDRKVVRRYLRKYKRRIS